MPKKLNNNDHPNVAAYVEHVRSRRQVAQQGSARRIIGENKALEGTPDCAPANTANRLKSPVKQTLYDYGEVGEQAENDYFRYLRSSESKKIALKHPNHNIVFIHCVKILTVKQNESSAFLWLN